MSLCADDALESPVDFKGRLVKGSKGAVAVEAEECSKIGVQSKIKPFGGREAENITDFMLV